MSLKVVVILFMIQNAAQSARILGIFHERSFSHQILGTKLLFELASKGHEVTMLTPVVPKTVMANFTAIQLDLGDQGTDSIPIIFELASIPIWDRIAGPDEIGLIWADGVLKDKNVQRLLKSNQHFDLVIMEQLANHALRGFCYHYKAICVILSTMGPTWLTNEQMGNPHNPSYMPDFFVNYPPVMNFYQRLHNAFLLYSQKLYFSFYYVHKHTELMQKYFPGAPHLNEIFYNTSLMLVNSHYSTSNTVPNLPNVIEIGGFHIDPPKRLPENIETFLNEAKHGAIYFSMGSILKLENMDKIKLNSIIKVLGQLPQKVLWKSGEVITDVPSNVLVVKWAPQADVLAHPNIKLFVTHGGLLSTTEAISRGVPILGISVFADQGLNSALSEMLGYGIAVPYESFTEERFDKAVNELLNNSTYMKHAKRRSKVFNDQPTKPLDRAVYWIEYVIRYKGAPHLRSAALNLTWYQHQLLDVLSFMLLLLGLSVFILQKLVTLIFRKKVNVDTMKKVL